MKAENLSDEAVSDHDDDKSTAALTQIRISMC